MEEKGIVTIDREEDGMIGGLEEGVEEIKVEEGEAAEVEEEAVIKTGELFQIQTKMVRLKSI